MNSHKPIGLSLNTKYRHKYFCRKNTVNFLSLLEYFCLAEIMEIKTSVLLNKNGKIMLASEVGWEGVDFPIISLTSLIYSLTVTSYVLLKHRFKRFIMKLTGDKRKSTIIRMEVDLNRITTDDLPSITNFGFDV